MKRILSLLLSFTLLCSSLLVFHGCAKNNVIVLTIYNENIDDPGYLTGWYADIIREKFNIQIQYVSVSDTGFSAYVAQNDLADVIIFSTTKHYRIARDGNVLLDWNTKNLLSTYAPDLAARQTASLSKNKAENGSDAIYGIYANVSINDDIYSKPACLYLNTKYYEALQSPKIADWSQLQEVVSQMLSLACEDLGTAYGFSSSSAGDDVMLSFLQSAVALYGYEAFGFGIYNAATDDYQECLDTNGLYYQMITIFNEWYQNGLVDSASSTQTNAELQKKYDKGQVMMSFTPQDGYTAIALTEATPNRYQQDPAGSGSIISIGANCKYPDYALKLIEWLYSTEGYLTNCYGPQGVTWDFDSDGNPYITELGATLIADPTLNLSDYNCGYSGRLIDGISHLNTNTWDLRSTFPGNASITFDSTTWTANAAIGSDPREDFPCSYVPATHFEMADMGAEESIPYAQVAAVVNSYSWFIIYSKTPEDITAYTDGMISLARSYRYNLPDDFFKEQLALYRASLGYPS